MATAERPVGPKLQPHNVILRPLVTEKGTHQSTHQHHNAYSFQVNLWATKIEIKAAVQELFNVRVEKVRTQLRLGKKRRFLPRRVCVRTFSTRTLNNSCTAALIWCLSAHRFTWNE